MCCYTEKNKYHVTRANPNLLPENTHTQTHTNNRTTVTKKRERATKIINFQCN